MPVQQYITSKQASNSRQIPIRVVNYHPLAFASFLVLTALRMPLTWASNDKPFNSAASSVLSTRPCSRLHITHFSSSQPLRRIVPEQVSQFMFHLLVELSASENHPS